MGHVRDGNPYGLTSSFAKASEDKSEAALHGWQSLSALIWGSSSLCAFAALREILSSRFQAGEAVGGPGLGADAVVDEEKAGGIVFFFDGF
jgi:hypothetical protein